MRVTAAPRKYPDELRERATRMAVELTQSVGEFGQDEFGGPSAGDRDGLLVQGRGEGLDEPLVGPRSAGLCRCELAGVDPKTVRRYIAARDAGQPTAGPSRRPRIIDVHLPKI